MSIAQDVRYILVIEDQKSKRIVALKENTYTIGRDPNASIILYDRQVSRHHATLLRITDYQKQESIYRIIDGNLQGKKSTNGLLINGKYALSHELKTGDVIRFGSGSKASYHIVDTALDSDFLKTNEPKEKLTEPGLDLGERESDRDDEEKLVGKNTIVFNKSDNENNLDKLSYKDTSLSKKIVADLNEFNPNPIIEITYTGEITYINSATTVNFPDLTIKKLEHQLLKGLINPNLDREKDSLVREVKIDEEVFEQYIYYLPEKQLIRLYLVKITKYKTVETKLQTSQERYKFLVNKTTEGIFLLDPQTQQIVEANLGVCELLGYGYEEILKLNIYQLIALDREIIDTELQLILENTSYFIDESLFRCKDGSLISVETKVSRDRYAERDVLCFSIRDISERKRSEEKMQYQGFHDPLTNLPNRQLFNQLLSLALNNAKKNQSLLAILFLNLDSFNTINNTLGHTIGDRLLQNFAQRLLSCIRAGDTVARWGSDDFTILLPRTKNIEEVTKLIEKIFDDLKQSFIIEDHELRVKASIGIAIYPQDGNDETLLLKNAATALTKTKEQGRNSYQFYTPVMSSEASLLLKLENALHRALDRREFSLYYQPQIKISTGEVTGIEALLRWEVPEIGFIQPKILFAQAEKTDVILHISQWILQTACEQNLAWQDAGLPPVPMAVNLSNREFQQPNLVETVARVLQKTGLDPQWLELELTEKILRQNLRSARQIFQDFHNLGIRLALDDFGLGFSSIGYLKQFPFRTLKINQTFIRDLRGSSQDFALISALLTLGRGFNLRVVAEGVESSSQLELLKSVQCEEVQGYLYSRPLRSSEATQFLTKVGKKE